MNEKRYEKRLELQQKMISRQSQQIENLNAEIINLRLQIEEKDNVISSIEPMRNELSQNIAEIKKGKEEYKRLIDELKMMKSIMNKEVFKNRWWLIKLLLK